MFLVVSKLVQYILLRLLGKGHIDFLSSCILCKSYHTDLHRGRGRRGRTLLLAVVLLVQGLLWEDI